MKISELVKRTGVPKETIHFYIREGLLRKPRKSGVNSAEYNERYVDQIQMIKDLRDNFYLPIPEIKKVVKEFKKQSPSDQAVSQFYSRFFRPADRLLAREVIGRDAFLHATGLGRKWLNKAEEWELITPEHHNGDVVFSPDDLAIGKLMVDMDQLGFGPKDGFDPEDLRQIAEFLKKYVATASRKYYENNLEKLTSKEYAVRAPQYHEVISLFFYHLYRKLIRQATNRLIEQRKPKDTERKEVR
ncbi:Transcriptional regulator, MerR family [Olavius sp. associated proteobacterium Delta 1]|nr:Transcriptional regulator, MerR family [Olavius sp. associated proteobacterium Delta 1]